MTADDWAVMRQWLRRCFPAVEAMELYALNVEDGRRHGCAPPEYGPGF